MWTQMQQTTLVPFQPSREQMKVAYERAKEKLNEDY
jgi:hypothetical protein